MDYGIGGVKNHRLILNLRIKTKTHTENRKCFVPYKTS